MTNRNDPCPCGSGKKYKKCCLGKAPPAAAAAPAPAVSALVTEAQREQQAGRLEQARALYERARVARPRDPVIAAGLGYVLGQLGRQEEGIALLREAIEHDASRALYHLCLADLLHRSGHAEEAWRCAVTAKTRDPGNLQAHCLIAITLGQLNRLEEAERAARAAVALAPDDANAQLVHAGLRRRIARESGDREAGLAAARDARVQLDKLLAQPGLPAVQRVKPLSDLGFVLDALGEYDEAFAAFAESGRLQAAGPRAQRLDGGQWGRRIARYRAGVAPALLDRWRGAEFDDGLGAPCFLVGFPRSGTTMTEQVLAAHPDVVTSDEAELLVPVRKALGRDADDREDIPGLLAALDEDAVRELRVLYGQGARDAAGVELAGKVFVDKQPMHIVDVPLIATLFPDARVLVALRDPRDVCLSCFMQRFNLNSAMVNFLTLEGTAALYVETMALWQWLKPMLSIDFIEVRYENTVTDLQGQASRILDLFGLPFDEQVLTFHERARERAISTPSAAAVTEPVNTRAVGRWQRYERHLEPILEQLRPYVEAFGYV